MSWRQYLHVSAWKDCMDSWMLGQRHDVSVQPDDCHTSSQSPSVSSGSDPVHITGSAETYWIFIEARPHEYSVLTHCHHLVDHIIFPGFSSRASKHSSQSATLGPHSVACRLLLINRLRRDGTLSWRWYTLAVGEIWTCDLRIASPGFYHMATSAPNSVARRTKSSSYKMIHFMPTTCYRCG